MEAIRNYLEGMFLNLPNTPEVYQAKEELLQMMEDKYTELREEGKTENEAVGIVISEFGNLDDLAEDLGIEKVIKGKEEPTGKPLPLEKAKEFLADSSKNAFLKALATMLCIMCVCPPIFGEGIMSVTNGGNIIEAISVSLMFVMVAIAVGIFAYSGITMSKWKPLRSDTYRVDFGTTEYVDKAFASYKPTYAAQQTIGIVLCVLCCVPAILFGSLDTSNELLDVSSGGLLFVLVGVGVFLMVQANMKKNSYLFLMRLNGRKTVGGHYVPTQSAEPRYRNKYLAAIMPVYWPSVTCLYLIVSFLTFDWYITWIIWPVAAVAAILIRNMSKIGDNYDSQGRDK